MPVELEARDARVKAVIRRAEAVGARFLVLLGDDELAKGEVGVKDLAARTQDALGLEAALEKLASQAARIGASVEGGD